MTDQQIAHLIDYPTWDTPFFKRLAPNDTGNSAWHEGGMAIPVELTSVIYGRS